MPETTRNTIRVYRDPKVSWDCCVRALTTSNGKRNIAGPLAHAPIEYAVS